MKKKKEDEDFVDKTPEPDALSTSNDDLPALASKYDLPEEDTSLEQDRFPKLTLLYRHSTATIADLELHDCTVWELLNEYCLRGGLTPYKMLGLHPSSVGKDAGEVVDDFRALSGEDALRFLNEIPDLTVNNGYTRSPD